MAIINGGIFGVVTKSVGDTTFSTWKGINVAKRKATKVANPQTTGQVNQRTKFKAVVELASVLNSAIIKPLWDRFAKRQSGNNAFVAANIEVFNDSGVFTNRADLIISKGKMSATPITGDGDTGNNKTLTWSTALTDQFQQSTDLAYALWYDSVLDKFFWNAGTVLRSAGTISIDTGATVGQDGAVYLAFKRADGTIVSDTAYRAVS